MRNNPYQKRLTLLSIRDIFYTRKSSLEHAIVPEL